MPDVVAGQDWVAPENVVFKDTGKGPRCSAVTGEAPTSLAEIRAHAVELSPTNRHLGAIGWIDRDRWLVRRVAGNVLSVACDVHLITGERAMLRDHCLRGSRPPNEHRSIARAFEWLGR